MTEGISALGKKWSSETVKLYSFEVCNTLMQGLSRIGPLLEELVAKMR